MKIKVLFYEHKTAGSENNHFIYFCRMMKITTKSEKNWIPYIPDYTLEMACFNGESDEMIKHTISKIDDCFNDPDAVRESINQFDKFIDEMKDKLQADEVEQRR